MPSYGSGLRKLFLLERGLAFLNHGGYGLTPRAVLAVQRHWQSRLESQPVRFLGRELPELLAKASGALAQFLGADPGDLVLVENATAGVNAVLRRLALKPGEEILITDQAYPAVRLAARHVCSAAGARLVEVPLALPFAAEETILAAIAARLSERTRLVILDLITSASAAILPVAGIAAIARDAGSRVLVDAAHGPGQIDIALPALGADWVTGNAHKWLFAPKGTGFLWARPESQDALHPLAISNGYGQGFQAEFAWTGTRDPSAWLSLPAAIAFYEERGGHVLRLRNRALAEQAGELLARELKTDLAARASMRAAMAAIALPAKLAAQPQLAAKLHDRLLERHRIEVPVNLHAGRLWLRISAQIYNELAEYEHLGWALAAEID
jgi:isopenicillin-N epimerase